MLSALGTASTMLVMLRHADRIKIGCATGGLHCLCRTDREHAWKGAAYYPFTQMINWARGVSLMCRVECEKYDVPGYAIDDMNQYRGFSDVDTVQAAAALDGEHGELTVFVINADLDLPQQLTLDARGFEGWRFVEHIEMHAKAPGDENTWERPDALVPRIVPGTRFESGKVTAKLEKASWNVFRFVRDAE
ncbi:MAG: alpha-L-arabinofuranosidase, partial [Clostridia bacterium]|nr:alpha-L-arabinofuranosidase [Clostridia bacterium]